jgi:hypothetical protein
VEVCSLAGNTADRYVENDRKNMLNLMLMVNCSPTLIYARIMYIEVWIVKL